MSQPRGAQSGHTIWETRERLIETVPLPQRPSESGLGAVTEFRSACQQPAASRADKQIIVQGQGLGLSV